MSKLLKVNATARSTGGRSATTTPKSTGNRSGAGLMRPKATTANQDLAKAVRAKSNGAPDIEATRVAGRLQLKAGEELKDEAIDPRLQLRAQVFGTESIEDAFRQTGRTTRMLELAAETARTGTPVLIVMKDEARVIQVLSTAKFYANTRVNVVSHNPKLPEFDWNTLEPTAPDYQGWKVFVDHDVAYCYHKHIFALLGWDQAKADDKSPA